MKKIEIISLDKNTTSPFEIDETVLSQFENTFFHKQAIYDCVVAERNSLRQATHKTKTRAEVSGGGRKPWKQKGTGRARHGSIRSPIWRGGGVNFGPTPQRNYSYQVNKKVHKLAFSSAFFNRLNENNLFIFDSLEQKSAKTKDFLTLLSNQKIDINKKVLICTNNFDENLALAIRNTLKIGYQQPNTVSVSDLLHHEIFIFDKEGFSAILEGKIYGQKN